MISMPANMMLAMRGDSLKGKICTVSGSGNVAQYTVEKVTELGGKCVSLSDSDGTIYDPDGINPDKLAWLNQHYIKEGDPARLGAELGGTWLRLCLADASGKILRRARRRGAAGARRCAR